MLRRSAKPAARPHGGRWQTWLRIIRGYTIGASITGAAVAYVELTRNQIDGRPLLFTGILLASWFGGVRAGFLATVAAVLVAFYSFTPPFDSLDPSKYDDGSFLSFVLMGCAANAFNLWRHRNEARLLRTRNELEQLHQNAASLLQARDAEGVGRITVSQCKEALGASAALLAVPGDDPQFHVLAAVGFSPEMTAAWTSLPSPLAESYELQRSLLFPELRPLAERFPEFLALARKQPEMEAIAAIPLAVRGRRHGMLVLAFPGQKDFEREEMKLISTLANQSAHALDRFELLTSARTQAAELNLLSEGSVVLSEAELESGAILGRLVDFCVEHLADSALGFVTVDDGSGLCLAANRDLNPEVQRLRGEMFRSRRLRLGEGLSGTVALSRQGRLFPQTPPELALAQWKSEKSIPDVKAGSAVSVPIEVAEHLLGVLTIGRTKGPAFRPSEARVVHELAKRAGLVLMAAQHASEAQQELERRRKVEEDLVDNEARLRQALAAKDEFLALVSHELRTPLTTVRGNANVLSRRPDLPEGIRSEALADLSSEAERLTRIVENMLLLARLDVGKEPEREPVLLHRVVKQAIAEFLHEAPKANLRLHSIDEKLIVQGNEGYIKQILENLLSNAVKYSPLHLAVEIDVQNGGTFGIVSVADRGVGISSEDAGDLFKPFYRKDEQAGVTSGLGIGLAVCKRLVDAQGGTIDAVPREGGGSVFSIRLPVWRLDASAS